MDPSYQFAMVPMTTDTPISFLVDNEAPLTVTLLQQCLSENEQWWNTVLQEFLRSTASYFSRPYTVQHLYRMMKHVLEVREPLAYPLRISCIPKRVEITAGVVYVYWDYETHTATIVIPDEEEAPLILLPVSDKVDASPDLEEWNVDTLPEEKNSTEAINLSGSTRLYDKQRVKEARMKAKLAIYRAQYQLNRYYDKYGDEVSESEPDSGSDLDEDEDEDD